MLHIIRDALGNYLLKIADDNPVGPNVQKLDDIANSLGPIIGTGTPAKSSDRNPSARTDANANASTDTNTTGGPPVASTDAAAGTAANQGAAPNASSGSGSEQAVTTVGNQASGAAQPEAVASASQTPAPQSRGFTTQSLTDAIQQSAYAYINTIADAAAISPKEAVRARYLTRIFPDAINRIKFVVRPTDLRKINLAQHNKWTPKLLQQVYPIQIVSS